MMVNRYLITPDSKYGTHRFARAGTLLCRLHLLFSGEFGKDVFRVTQLNTPA